MRKLLSISVGISLICLMSFGMFFFGYSVETSTFTYDDLELGANQTAMQNLTDEVTSLLTDIIPVFVILGVFGAVIAYVGRMTKGFGS